MGKRARRRARHQEAEADERQASADAVLGRRSRSRSETVAELRRLADGRRIIDRRIDDVVDQLIAKGVGWVPIADALGVTRQAARQAFLRRRSGAH